MTNERPPFLGEQVGKLAHTFRQMGVLHAEGRQTPILVYEMRDGQVRVDKQFIDGMEKVAVSIKGDLRAAGKEHLFYETFRKERGA